MDANDFGTLAKLISRGGLVESPHPEVHSFKNTVYNRFLDPIRKWWRQWSAGGPPVVSQLAGCSMFGAWRQGSILRPPATLIRIAPSKEYRLNYQAGVWVVAVEV